MHCARFLIILSFITLSRSARVMWLANLKFNSPLNFNDGGIPCSKETVVFPQTMDENIVIESGTTVAGFILPENGEILLDEGTIELGPMEESGCKTGNVYYIERKIASWNQPDVWSSVRINEATPDAERVPCFDDTVVFPPNGTFTVLLPDVVQQVRAVEIGGQTIYEDLKGYVTRQTNAAQGFILNDLHETGISIENFGKCNSPAGCPCQKSTVEVNCMVKFCPIPPCVNPIKPIGNCCKICAGTIVLDVDQSFDFMQFQGLVAGIVDTFGQDALTYHIGRLPGDKVQVVVVDKNNYELTSAKVASAISRNMDSHLSHVMLVSGGPLSSSGIGVRLFVSTFFAVVLVMGGIYSYYYKLPQINYPVIMGRGQANMFSRFNRRTDSVVSLTRRDSVGPMRVSTATAFRNPLYDSKRGRVSVVESVDEE